MKKPILLLVLLLLVACAAPPASSAPTPTTVLSPLVEAPTPTPTIAPSPQPTDSPLPPTPSAVPSARIAVIGDYGTGDANAAAVAGLVLAWEPDFIVTTGDNNYPSGAADTIDAVIGQFYHAYIGGYSGTYGEGSEVNRFFPVLGNHDWDGERAQPYFDYFNLPGNERYYDFIHGPVHFFLLDSDTREPDGVGLSSRQAEWLQAGLTTSRAPWQVVVMHHPPYSSARHGSTEALQWPYAEWGADLVLAGHDHTYERLEVDGLTYVVNGLGGQARYYFIVPLAESVVRYRAAHGALFITATVDGLTAEFLTVTGEVVDTFSLGD
ncbi:MAG: alkaline phosphatase [Anaerolineae bacterium]|nr:MAG: alkaline phosphatase [Anaerolineae bacterium]